MAISTDDKRTSSSPRKPGGGALFSDKQRMARCRELQATVDERAQYQRGGGNMNMPWNDRMTKMQQLSKRVLDLVRQLDHDTDRRLELKMHFPEPSELMTKHTRRVYFSGAGPRDKKVGSVHNKLQVV